MRAQAHTLEGVTASLLVVMSVVFALQVTAVTPLTASTASQHIENQERAAARGVLATADANDTLKAALLTWNESARSFYNASARGYYATGGPPNAFGAALNETFANRGIAFNVNVYYLSPSGQRKRREMVHLGEPSDNAVTVVQTVTLYDDDHLHFTNGTAMDTTLSNAAYFVPDLDAASNVYGVVEVEVVVWRM